jgi:NAD-dependent SIR2 family protein deacetylase
MLSWSPGLRDSDGIWAKHWYHEVATSTGFRKFEPRKSEAIPDRLYDVLNRSRESYDKLYEQRLH